MTVASETNRSGPYNGNGSATVFSYGFRIVDAAHLKVVKTSAFGVDTTLPLTTGYTVSGVGNAAGGQITLLVAPAAGEKVTILRDVPFVQGTDLENQGAYYAETVEDALDLATMRDQQLAEELGRTIHVPPGTVGIDLGLPAPEANHLLTWNSDANGLTNLSPSDLASVVAYGQARADVFTGNGVQTVFGLSQNPVSQANLDIAVGGVVQLPVIDYVWTSGTVLTFTSAPPNGVKVLVRYLQGLPVGDLSAANIEFSQSTPGVPGSVLNKLKHEVATDDEPYRSLANATLTVDAAITAAGERGEVFVADDYVVTGFDNPEGLPLTGPGTIKDATGRQFNRSVDREKQLLMGREYLAKLPIRLIQSPYAYLTTVIAGDSRAAKYGADIPENRITASIAGTAMTVTAVGSNVMLTKGSAITRVSGGSLPANTLVVSGHVDGGVGTYTLSNDCGTVASQEFVSSNGGGFAGWSTDTRLQGQPDSFFDLALKRKGLQNPLRFRNRAIGGTGVAYCDVLQDLTADAGGTDLILIDAMYNDAQNGRAAALADLETKLAGIRANTYGAAGNVDVIVLGPHAGFDPASGKLYSWCEEIDAAVWELCKRYKCLYYRQHLLINDPEWLAGVGGSFLMDHPTPSTLIHPGMVYQSLRYGRLVDELFSGSDLQQLRTNTEMPVLFDGNTTAWARTGVGGAPAAYAVWEGSQTIRLEGTVTGGTVAKDGKICRVPLGWEPKKLYRRVATASDGSGGAKPVAVYLDGDGYVILGDASANNAFVDLSGITFNRFM